VSVPYIRREPPAPADKVEALERRIGRRLPSDYRGYLLAQDGGRLANNHETLNTIYGVGDVPEWAEIWFALDTWDEAVPGLLPVAYDSFSNQYCISLRDEDEGSVWFVHHEAEEDDNGTVAPIEVTRKAASWSGFLASLQPAQE
jgi:cell wall assembly regulator SMI1